MDHEHAAPTPWRIVDDPWYDAIIVDADEQVIHLTPDDNSLSFSIENLRLIVECVGRYHAANEWAANNKPFVGGIVKEED